MARPCSSRVHPAVATCEYGARPRRATEVSSEEWNQPRCWSPPSRYRHLRCAFALLEGCICGFQLRIGLADGEPAGAGVEPDVENVGFLAEFRAAAVGAGGAGGQQVGHVGGVPGLGALALEQIDDLAVERRVDDGLLAASRT